LGPETPLETIAPPPLFPPLNNSFKSNLISLHFTTGFGDYVPGSSFTGELTLNQFIKMTFTTLYCLMGLALISMGINLASEQVM